MFPDAFNSAYNTYTAIVIHWIISYLIFFFSNLNLSNILCFIIIHLISNLPFSK